MTTGITAEQARLFAANARNVVTQIATAIDRSIEAAVYAGPNTPGNTADHSIDTTGLTDGQYQGLLQNLRDKGFTVQEMHPAGQFRPIRITW